MKSFLPEHCDTRFWPSSCLTVTREALFSNHQGMKASSFFIRAKEGSQTSLKLFRRIT